jgi:dihydrofolate reductase
MANPTPISLVVAVADNGVIGRAGRLPWHLPDDLKHFKAVTMGKPVLMGRRTFESVGRPLPGRRNLVLTRSHDFGAAGVERVGSMAEAMLLIHDAAELCVIGGAEIYSLTLPLAERAYLTQVHAAVSGDTWFPLQQLKGWQELERTEHGVDERHEYPMSFLTLRRQLVSVSPRYSSSGSISGGPP